MALRDIIYESAPSPTREPASLNSRTSDRGFLACEPSFQLRGTTVRTLPAPRPYYAIGRSNLMRTAHWFGRPDGRCSEKDRENGEKIPVAPPVGAVRHRVCFFAP